MRESESRERYSGDDSGGVSDEALAAQAQAGDREARNALFLRHYEMMKMQAIPAKRMAGRRGSHNGPIDEHDIDQELFLAFCELLERWEPERTPLVPYLKKMVRWSMLHYVRDTLHYGRKRKVVRMATYDGQETGEESEPAQEPVDEPLYEIESREGWQERTGPLKDEWKQSLSLRFYLDLTSRQIASAHGRSRRAVNRELHAAVSAIRESVEDEWEGV